MSESLPHCDDLFLRFFDRWYSESDRKRRGFRATRPDLMQVGELVGITESQAGPLPEPMRIRTRQQLDAMVSAAREDWPKYLGVSGDVTADWIGIFDRFWDSNRIETLVQSADPTDFGNQYIVITCEFGAMLGHVMQQLQPRLIWYLDMPYWESALVDPRTGFVIPVFHWAVKKMSSYGVDDGYIAKIGACFQALDNDAQ